MKKLVILFSILFISLFTLWQSTNKKNRQIDAEDDETEDDDDDYDEFVPDITGPRGERVFIGAGGGRYYTKANPDMYAGYNQ